MGESALCIIGFGCRIPGGVVDGKSYWNLLRDGRDAITDIPRDRWNAKTFYSVHGSAGKSVSRWGGFLNGIDSFEPACFGMSPRETRYVDPQQRLLLEMAFEAFEHAGIPLESLRGSRTGVFIGVSTGDYGQLQHHPQSHRRLSAFSAQGSAISIAANRLSYCFDLRGPSFALDTACSSSITAMDCGVKSLRCGESDCAVVGGINLILNPEAFISFTAASMLSPDGRCKAFDAAANGFVRSEGGGVVVMKRLQDAVRDGDPIRAVVVESGVNQDGRTNGITMPNFEAQKALLQDVYARAKVDPNTVRYVETHGTGTAVGDPIEAAALGSVFSTTRGVDRPLIMGSVKTNIGHLEASSGMASLIKALLIIEHREIPKNLHFSQPNPNIRFDEDRLQVSAEHKSWPAGEVIQIGINSFGFGGANAHLLVSEYIPTRSRASKHINLKMLGSGMSGAELKGAKTINPISVPARDFPLLITARSPESLKITAQNWSEKLAEFERAGVALQDVLFTAANRRSRFEYRLGMACATWDEFRECLDAYAGGETRSAMYVSKARSEPPKVALVFCGQGPQWAGMGRELAQAEPVFRDSLEECDTLMQAETGWSLLDEMYKPEKATLLHRTDITQPALFAMHAALANLWRSWGVLPDLVFGHSVGEIGAAYAAGRISLKSAVRIVCHRGRVLQEYSLPGAMLAVAASEKVVEAELLAYKGELCIAAVNSPNSVTVAGTASAVSRLEQSLSRRDIWCKSLKVSHAFHSPLVDPVRGPFLSGLGEIETNVPVCEMISTVTGEAIGAELEQPEYWWENIRRPVRFFSAVEEAASQNVAIYIEVGPHPVLNNSIKCGRLPDGGSPLVFPSIVRSERDTRTIRASFAAISAEGFSVDWNSVGLGSGEHVDLPPAPWNRERYWHESQESQNSRFQPNYHPLLGERVGDSSSRWNKTLDRVEQPWLSQHGLNGQVIFPAAGFIELSLAAATRTLGVEQVVLDEFDIQRALFLSLESPPEVQVSADDSVGHLTISSRVGGPKQPWTKHSQTNFRDFADSTPPSLNLADWSGPSVETISVESVYSEFQSVGFEYGPVFSGIRSVLRNGKMALAEIELDLQATDSIEDFIIHPGILDACFQPLLTVTPPELISPDRVYLPERCRRIRLFHRVGARVRCKVNLKLASDFVVRGDVSIYNEDGKLAIDLLDFQCRGVSLGSESRATTEQWTFETRWVPSPLPGAAMQTPAIELQRTLSEIVDAAETDAEKFRCDSTYDYICSSTTAQNQLARAYFEQYLHTIKVSKAGDTLDLRAMLAAGQLIESHQQLLERCLQRLVTTGDAQFNGDVWRILRDIAPPDIAGVWREIIGYQPLLYPMLRLLELCAGRLDEILKGTLDPLEVFFAEEGFNLLNQVYIDLPWPQYSNTFIRNALREIRASVPANRPLRVLEVGAGTGGTAGYVLSGWSADDGEYWFTDISPVLVARAKDQFQQHEFIHYQTLDLERDFAEQGVPQGAFDVIIAVDVLHAVGDLSTALKRCRNALAGGGVLLVRELTEAHFCWDLIFGLMKGWWKYQGDPIRPDGPLLNLKAWEALLSDVGFEEVLASNSSYYSETLGAVLAARRPLGETLCAPVETNEELPAAAMPTLPPASNVRSSPSSLTINGDWLVFSDEQIGPALVDRLRCAGSRCVSIRRGDRFDKLDKDNYRIDPGAIADMEQLRTHLGDLKNGVQVVHLFSMARHGELSPYDEAVDAEVRMCHSLMHMLQLFAFDKDSLKSDRFSRIIVATQGACSVFGEKSPQPLGGMLHGLARVVASEFNTTAMQVIDLDSDDYSCETLFAEVTVGENQISNEESGKPQSIRPQAMVVWRGGRRFVPRLQHLAPRSYRVTNNQRPFELALDRGGNISALTLCEIDVPPPGPGEVQVKVQYIPLNFRDLLRILGRYPVDKAEDGRPGDECTGFVSAVGPGVEGFSPGDRVLGMRCGFRSLINVDQNLIAQVPEHLTLLNAASMLNSYLTSYCSLLNSGELKADDSILIHSAAGGIGLGALQIASNVGAEIFATAGSDSKRCLIEKYGVNKVMNSRTLDFYDQILDATDGRGVDVVLNSLSGLALMRSLSCVAPHGRFLELGKRDFFENTRVGMYPFHANVSFHAVYLESILLDHPEVGRRILTEVFSDRSMKKFPPLLSRLFPVTRLSDALRLMSKGEHLGKQIIDLSQHWSTVRPKLRRPVLRGDASYLISGAFGGVGLVVARWLVQRGARHLTMLSRSGPQTNYAKSVVEELRSQGVNFQIEQCDIADPTALSETVNAVRDKIPIAGVLHLAMVLDDERLVDLDAERFHRVMRPKVRGGWNLHHATLDDDLDLFVMFSSISAAVGNYGQAPYAAGNAALESLVQHRRAQGLAGSAIQWGAIGEVGYVAQNEQVHEMLAKRGFKTLSPADIADALDRSFELKSNVTMVNRMDWRRFVEFFPHLRETPGLFTSILSHVEDPQREHASGGLLEAMKAAPGARVKIATEFVTNAAARILGTSPAGLDLQRPLTEMGLDSLMAVELANVFESEFKVSLPISAISRDASIIRLSQTLLSILFGEDQSADVPAELAKTSQHLLQELVDAESGQPLFVFYPADGSLEIYDDLVETTHGEFPIIGLSPHGDTPAANRTPSLAQLADDCAQSIEHHTPVGAIRLLGFSFGGMLAVQTAIRLQEMGREIEFVGTIDSIPPVGENKNLSGQVVEFLCQLFARLGSKTGILQATPPEQLRQEAEKAVKGLNAVTITQWFVGEHIADGVPKQLAYDYVNQIAARIVLHLEETAIETKLNAPIHCWTACEGVGVNAADWERFTDGGVVSFAVTTDHFSIMEKPVIELIAGQLRDALRKQLKKDANT